MGMEDLVERDDADRNAPSAPVKKVGGEDAADHLAEVNRCIVKIADPMLAPTACALATAAFRRRSNVDVVAVDGPEALAALVVDAARFLSERRKGEIALRVSQPDEGGCLIDINTEDGPFLVSTLTEELSRHDLDVHDLLHPILGVVRRDNGTIKAIVGARHAPNRESWIHVRLEQRLDEQARRRLHRELSSVLADQQRVTADFEAMQDRVRDMIAGIERSAGTRYGDDEVRETVAFLTWLLDDHFVLMGARDYDLVTADGARGLRADNAGDLGVAVRHDATGDDATGDDATGDDATGYVYSTALADEVPGGIDDSALLTISRTAERSRVHRNERMICLAVNRVRDGEVTGQRRILGLLSQKAFAQPATAIPVLRRKLREILEWEDIVDHSHDERALRAIFEAIPKHELLAISTADLRDALVDLLESQKRQAVRMSLRRDDAGATVLVTVPRERFNADLRRNIQQLLSSRLGATGVDYHLSLTEGDQALLHFTFAIPEPASQVRLDDLQRTVIEVARTWGDRLEEALSATMSPADAEQSAERWARALPDTYTASTSPQEAVGDIAELENLWSGDGEIRVRIVPSGAHRLGVKLFKAGEGIELSSVLPMLESLGLIAVEEIPHRVELPTDDGSDVQILHIHVVEVRGDLDDISVDADGRRIADALEAIWRGDAAADSLNRLVLLARLDWRDVTVLRAYRRYRRQVGTSFTENYQNEALCQYPGIARALMALFAARFDPDPPADDEADEKSRGHKNPEAASDAARRHVIECLEDVSRLDQDRILRGYLGLLDATLRTNHYVRPRRPWLSFKFDSVRVPDLPKPVPYREIFVYSPDMEGIHLRGGSVARGGLRWSDRLEDVRTEVLGLMKAQVVKNSMIVPTGSKGGFVLKRPPADGDQLREAVREQYAVFIRGLLDLTDNVVDGKVVPPERVVRADDDDPYLVVAADRGTATFSDLANSISEEYGYWLRDAFASGGSRGYDHKEMGITARGAWVTARRHFYELDVDVQTEPTTITGIGDMSGDVFGNGLRQSRAVKLVAAFDHRDIFLDPDPDPEVAFAERERLYQAERSTWQEYDRDVISAGGGVWARTVKSIPLSDEVRELLRTDAEELSPPELVRTILRAPVDLLFAGGIGTFVKSPGESNDSVGDRANDAIRVNADELGARVVSEGGNLAVTQRGRIDFARRGGRINLDAIDNAGGVATSDAEVNLKILLQIGLDRGEIDAQQRDELLAAVKDDVADDVLFHVWRQAWAISRELSTSPAGMEAYEQLLVDLENAGHIERTVDVLPSSDEMRRRREAGAGLTRPELGVLMGASKRDLVDRLLDSDVPDDPALRPLLVAAFPSAVSERFGDVLEEHRLHRELVATALAGEIVDRLGITYVNRTAHERGCGAADVAACYWIARQVIGADHHWADLDALEPTVVPALQLDLTEHVDELMDACIRTYLREMPVPSLGDLIEADRTAFHGLRRYVVALQGTPGALRTGRVGRWTDLGVEPELAERIALLTELKLGPDVAAVARRLDLDVDVVADAFLTVTDRLPLDRLYAKLDTVTPVGRWERWQLRGLVDELRDLRRQVATAALAQSSAEGTPDGQEAVEEYLRRRTTVLDRVGNLTARLDEEPDAGLAAVTVVVTALGAVLD